MKTTGLYLRQLPPRGLHVSTYEWWRAERGCGAKRASLLGRTGTTSHLSVVENILSTNPTIQRSFSDVSSLVL